MVKLEKLSFVIESYNLLANKIALLEACKSHKERTPDEVCAFNETISQDKKRQSELAAILKILDDKAAELLLGDGKRSE